MSKPQNSPLPNSRADGISRRDFLVGAAAGTGLLALAGCGGSTAFRPDVDETTLTVRYAERTLGGVRVRTRTYNGTIPGPTMRTAPGRTMRVKVINQLPPNGTSNGGGGGGGHAAEVENTNPHNFNTTNVHFHGIQARPHLFEPQGTTNPSAKMVSIEPGESYTYEFRLPNDHPCGLHWYHPHHHGSTAVQVAGGMAGLIVITGPIDQVPEIAAAREEFLALQTVRLDPSADDPDLYVLEPLEGKTPAEGGFKLHGHAKLMYLLNGEAIAWRGPEHNAPVQSLGTANIEMRPGEVVRFRMLNGTDEQLMPIELDGHELHVIGWDGVNTLAPMPQQVVEVAPGNRLEFLVKASLTPGTYTLKQNPVTGQQFEDSNGMPLATITVLGDPMDMALPTSLPTPTREYPVIQSSDIAATHNVRLETLVPYANHLTGIAFTMNGQIYSETRVDHTSARGTCEEWTIEAVREGHPFHLHVNSFQVIEVNGQPLDTPLVKDTVWVPKDGSVKIRVRFVEFAGKTVYHCHILNHEDLGMMQNLLIV